MFDGLAGIWYSLGDSTVNCASDALLFDLPPCLFSSFRYSSLMKSSYFGSVLDGLLMMNSSSVSSTSIVAGGCSVSGRQFAKIAVRLRATKSYVGSWKRVDKKLILEMQRFLRRSWLSWKTCWRVKEKSPTIKKLFSIMLAAAACLLFIFVCSTSTKVNSLEISFAFYFFSSLIFGALSEERHDLSVYFVD